MPEPPPNDLSRHEPALLLLARCRLPGWARRALDPDDLVQQTLLEAIKDRDRIAAMTSGEALRFLMTCLKNNLRDALRSEALRHGVSLDAVEESSRQVGDWIEAQDTSPSERVARIEQFARLAVALTHLPEAQRQAVEMRHLRGMSVAEVARELGSNPNAVSQLLHRGRTALHRALTESDG